MDNISSYLESTLLKPECNRADIERLCNEARLYGVYGVCIPPYYLSIARDLLEDSKVQIISVVGFPMGYTSISAKVEEVKRAINDGADELDVVANLAAIKDKRWKHVLNDIDSVTRATHLMGKVLKVIVEINLLKPDELKRLADICADSGVDFLKTSTGFHHQGPATVEQIQLLKQHTKGTDMRIKASAGIRERPLAEALIRAGADRIGTSSAVEIIGALKTL